MQPQLNVGGGAETNGLTMSSQVGPRRPGLYIHFVQFWMWAVLRRKPWTGNFPKEIIPKES